MKDLLVTWFYRAGIGLTAVACLVMVLSGVVGMEATYRDGQEFFLPIRPADPRALLQGDYMALAYEADVRDGDDIDFHARYAIVSLDQNSVAKFEKLAANLDELGAGQIALPVQGWGSRHLIQPRSYLFQEGQGAALSQARYAVFRYRDPKAPLLYGLADDQRATLTHK